MNRKMLWIAGGAALMICFYLSSCTYYKKELQYPTSSGCDTTVVTYTNSVVPLFSTYCYRCHSGAATDGNGVKLDVYASAKAFALFGAMLQMVNHQPGFEPMPKDAAKLSDCNIAIIRKWIEAGAPNN